MSDDLDIVIKVDPAGAGDTLDGLNAKLGEAEDRGPRVGAAVSGGMREGAESAGEAKEGVSAFGVALEGSVSQSILGRFGELGDALSGIASKGALEAAALVGLGAEVIHLSDEYTQLQNAAVRLVDSYDQVDGAIQQQMTLSQQLHGSLEQTMELSIAIKEHTEELGLTQMETTRFTKEWGEAVQISGHSLSEAGPAFERFSAALESGQGAGRALRELIASYPPIAKELEQHFGVDTPAALIKLANDGKMSISDLRETMDEFADENHAKFGQMTETMSQQWDHLKDQLTVTIGKLVESTGAIDAIANAFKGVGSAIELATGPLQTFVNELNKITGGHASTGDLFSGFLPQLLDKITPAKEGMQTFAQVIDDVEKQVARVHIEQLAPEMGEVDTAAHQLTETLAGDLNKAMQDLASGGMTALANDLKKLVDPWAKTADVAKGGVSELQKMIDAVNGPLDNIKKQEDALDEAYHRGAIGLKAYQAEQEKLLEQTKQLTDARDKLVAGFRGRFSEGPFTGGDNRQGVAAQSNVDVASSVHAQALQIQTDAITKAGAAFSDYDSKLAQLSDLDKQAGASASEHAAHVAELNKQFDQWQSPAEKMHSQLETLVQAHERGIVVGQAYADAIRKIGAEYDAASAKTSNSFGAGIELAFKKLGDETKNIAKDTEQAFTRAFDSINKNLITVIQGGKADWNSMLKGIESDVLNMGLKSAEGGIVNAITGGGGAGASQAAAMATAMTTGGATAATTIGGAMVTAGGTAASTIAAAIAGAGGASGAASAAGAAVGAATGGGATGGTFDIPHAASGYAGVIPQQSGADSLLTMFHVNPGERVKIQTPQQQLDEQRGGGGRPQVNLQPAIMFSRDDFLALFDSPAGQRVWLKLQSRLPPTTRR